LFVPVTYKIVYRPFIFQKFKNGKSIFAPMSNQCKSYPVRLHFCFWWWHMIPSV